MGNKYQEWGEWWKILMYHINITMWTYFCRLNFLFCRLNFLQWNFPCIECTCRCATWSLTGRIFPWIKWLSRHWSQSLLSLTSAPNILPRDLHHSLKRYSQQSSCRQKAPPPFSAFSAGIHQYIITVLLLTFADTKVVHSLVRATPSTEQRHICNIRRRRGTQPMEVVSKIQNS
jgi:hypothetical protein